MKEQTSYDSFCTENQCFSEKNSFFRFDPENVHVVQDHETRAISHVTFIRYLKTEQGKLTNHQQALSGLYMAVDQIVHEFTTFMRQNLFEKYIRVAEDLTKKGEILDLNSFTQGMREGSYPLLQSFLQFQRQDFSSKKSSDEKTEATLQRILKEVDKRKTELLNFMAIYCQNFTEDIADSLLHANEVKQNQTSKVLNRMASDYGRLENFLSNEEKTEVKIERQKQFIEEIVGDGSQEKQIIQEAPKRIDEIGEQKVSKVKIQEELRPSIFGAYESFQKNLKKEVSRPIDIEEDPNISDQEESQQQKGIPNVGKTKLIEKADKNPKAPRKARRKPQCENIVQIAPNEIAIREVYTDNSAIKKIKSLCPSVSSVHIFDQSFASSRIIKLLFTNFPTIRQLSFNCRIQTRVLSELPIEMQNLTRLCMRWDLKKFHSDYFIEKYFQRNKEDNNTGRARYTIGLILNNVDRNDHLWWFRDDQSVRSAGDYRTCDIYYRWIEAPLISSITTLVSLRLNSYLYGKPPLDHMLKMNPDVNIDVDLAKVIKNNRGLESLFLDDIVKEIHNDKEASRVVFFQKTLQELSSLPVFQVISVTGSSYKYPITLKAQQLMKLRNLKHLYLENVHLMEEQRENTLGDHFLEGFRNLYSLSLYGCKDIESKHINKIQGNCFAKITFINLGKTKVDKTCLKTIFKIKNLKSLQLQDLPISVSDIIEICQNYQKYYRVSHPLLRLNIKLKKLRWKLRAFHVFDSWRFTGQSVNWFNTEAKQKHPYRAPFGDQAGKPSRRESGQSKGQDEDFQQVLWNVYTANYEWTDNLSEEQIEERTLQYTSNFKQLQRLTKFFPTLEYLNITNNFNYFLSTDFTAFKCLRTLIKNSFYNPSDIKVVQNCKVLESPKQQRQNLMEDFMISLGL